MQSTMHNASDYGHLIVQDRQNPPSSSSTSMAVRGGYRQMNLDVVSGCSVQEFETETPDIHLEHHKFCRFHQQLGVFENSS
jgi:hypothetical protein